MTLPNVNVTVRDGALGILPPNAAAIPAILGVCSSGTVDAVESFSNIQALKDAMGVGPLVEAAAFVLAQSGGPVRVVRINGSTAGAAGAVTQSGSGPVVSTTSSAPYDDYEVVVEIQTGGAVATATFKYSLDDGETWSDEITTAATYTIPNTGIVLNFAAGTYVADETYSFDTTAPGYSTTDFNAAFDALIADGSTFGFILLVGAASSVANQATVAAAVKSKLDTAETNHRHAFAIIECPTDTDANVKSGFSAFTSDKVAIAVGRPDTLSVITGRIRARSAAWHLAARVAAIPMSEEPGRYARGPITGVVELDRDERTTNNLDDHGFATLRTFAGIPGFFITNGRIKAPAGSDFGSIPRRRVMDRAATVAYEALLAYANESVRVDATTGYIDERDAKAIEAEVEAALNAALSGHVSAVQAVVKRDENMLSTENLTVDILVTPLGYARTITMSIGFENPALTPS